MPYNSISHWLWFFWILCFPKILFSDGYSWFQGISFYWTGIYQTGYSCCLYFLSLCPFASINWPMSTFINGMIIRFPPISCHTDAWILANIWTFWFGVHLHTCVLMCMSLEQLVFVLLPFRNCSNLLVSWGVRSNLCTLSGSFTNYILTKP